MFIFYSIHYPYPDKEDLLVESMHQFGELMSQQPGFIFVAPYPFKNPENGTLMGVSFWESEEAFKAAVGVLRESRRNSSSRDWEIRPPDQFTMNSAR